MDSMKIVRIAYGLSGFLIVVLPNSIVSVLVVSLSGTPAFGGKVTKEIPLALVCSEHDLFPCTILPFPTVALTPVDEYN